MAGCEHKHLVFEDNSPLHIKCVDCNRYWTGVTHKGGMFDYTLMGADPIIDNSRHSKFEPARTEPMQKSDHFGRKLCSYCGHPEDSATCQKLHP